MSHAALRPVLKRERECLIWEELPGSVRRRLEGEGWNDPRVLLTELDDGDSEEFVRSLFGSSHTEDELDLMVVAINRWANDYAGLKRSLILERVRDL